MKVPEQVARLRDGVLHACPDAMISLDAPLNPDGEWWVDIRDARHEPERLITLVWRPDRGFGLFTLGEGYGDQPNELYRSADRAIARIGQLLTIVPAGDAALRPMYLDELRNLVGISQVALASSLSVQQSAVSRTEQRSDVKLSTLADYVSAMGGQLEVKVRFDDFEATIVPVREKGAA